MSVLVTGAYLLARAQALGGVAHKTVNLEGYALGMVLRQQGKQDEAAVEFSAEAVNRERIDEQMKALGLDVVQ